MLDVLQQLQHPEREDTTAFSLAYVLLQDEAELAQH